MSCATPTGRSRTALVAAGSLAAATVLVACGSTKGGPQPAENERPGRGGDLTVLASAVPDPFDPHRVAGDSASTMAHATLFRRLYVVVPGRSAAVADLAAGPARISDGGRTLTVPVRRTGRFGPQEGRRITARDVEHGLERALADPVSGPPARRLLGTVEGLGPIGRWRNVPGITAAGDDRLIVRLRVPTAEQALAGLATVVSVPIPAELPRRPGRLPAGLDVTSGAYVAAVDRAAPLAPGVLRLQRNPAWRSDGDPRPAYADTITFVAVMPGPASRRVLQGRGLVLAGPAPSPAARIARRRDSGQLAVSPLPVTRYVELNPRAAGLRDIAVRRALVAALDREAIRRAVGGTGSIASHYLPPGVPGHDESGGVDGTGARELREPGGDRRLAVAELRAAGRPDGRYRGPALTVAAGSSAADAAIVDVMRRSWSPLGVRLRVQTRAGAALRTACAAGSSRVAVCAGARTGGVTADPAALLVGLARDRAGARVDAAMDAALALPDGPVRTRAWAGINRAAVAAAIGAPWRWDARPLLASRDVLGVVDERSGTWDLAFTSLDARARGARQSR